MENKFKVGDKFWCLLNGEGNPWITHKKKSTGNRSYYDLGRRNR